MPVLEASGTQTATVGTEHTLATLTTNKTFVLVVDTATLTQAATVADVLELRVYTTVLTAGVSRVAYFASYVSNQAMPQKISIPIPSDISAVFTLKQTAGTGRAFPWKVLSI